MLKLSHLQNKFHPPIIRYPLNEEEKVRELHILKVILKKVISIAVRMYKENTIGKFPNSTQTKQKKDESLCKVGHFHI
jgi:hypothetical protein